MKFYGRTNETAILQRERSLSRENARFTVVTGRRRVGKTELIDHALNNGTDDYLYLLLTRQTEKNLCGSLQQEVRHQLGDKIALYGTIDRFIDLVREIFRYSETHPLTLVIDEFQEMDRINPAFYSELQGLWDEYHRRVKLHLVASGSVNRMMNRIFFDGGEPLYGRNTSHLRLRPFPVSLLKEILLEQNPNGSKDDLLALWTITGGIARYVALLMDAHATDRSAMLSAFFSDASPFLDEGRAILVQEFGNDYATYFTILSSIATGHTKFAEIKNDLGMDVGSYLSNLEKVYGLIRKVIPAYAPTGSKNAAYRIEDSFLRFWFRYVFKNATLVELGKFDRLRQLVDADLDAFSGVALERYFYCKFAEESDYTRMGAWWDRKGENEIDLVCEDDAAATLDFYEIKRDPRRFDRAALEAKVAAFLEKNPSKRNVPRTLHFVSLADM